MVLFDPDLRISSLPPSTSSSTTQILHPPSNTSPLITYPLRASERTTGAAMSSAAMSSADSNSSRTPAPLHGFTDFYTDWVAPPASQQPSSSQYCLTMLRPDIQKIYMQTYAAVKRFYGDKQRPDWSEIWMNTVLIPSEDLQVALQAHFDRYFAAIVVDARGELVPLTARGGLNTSLVPTVSPSSIAFGATSMSSAWSSAQPSVAVVADSNLSGVTHDFSLPAWALASTSAHLPQDQGTTDAVRPGDRFTEVAQPEGLRQGLFGSELAESGSSTHRAAPLGPSAGINERFEDPVSSPIPMSLSGTSRRSERTQRTTKHPGENSSDVQADSSPPRQAQQLTEQGRKSIGQQGRKSIGPEGAVPERTTGRKSVDLEGAVPEPTTSGRPSKPSNPFADPGASSVTMSKAAHCAVVGKGGLPEWVYCGVVRWEAGASDAWPMAGDDILRRGRESKTPRKIRGVGGDSTSPRKPEWS
ncbi:hypothetical protein CF326_g1791 [Tilletia indica]|uniref:Uncharacterized protein n=1 Tax=Tilletia indica TaxID=43049 RepID=A0A8T8SRE3_9BASI|nr:hypothetical protein CF326_g1791 [Tilletia indica]KAE8244694.1 hypothetical protein A4X13_0g6357 [Tilletia indica]